MSESSGQAPKDQSQDPTTATANPPQTQVDVATLLKLMEDEQVKAAIKAENAAREADKRQIETLTAIQKQSRLGLIIATVVAICTAGQWITIVLNNQGTADQTNKLILSSQVSATSAEQNAATAKNFAQSASQINYGIHDAVGNLGKQANGTYALAKIERDSQVSQTKGFAKVEFDGFTCYRLHGSSACDIVLSNRKGGDLATNVHVWANIAFGDEAPIKRNHIPLSSVNITELPTGPPEPEPSKRFQRICGAVDESQGKNMYIWGKLYFDGTIHKNQQIVPFCRFTSATTVRTNDLALRTRIP